jgi:hypothetical protein
MSRPTVESDAGLKQIVILWTTDNLVTFPQNAVTHITVGSTTPKMRALRSRLMGRAKSIHPRKRVWKKLNCRFRF